MSNKRHLRKIISLGSVLLLLSILLYLQNLQRFKERRRKPAAGESLSNDFVVNELLQQVPDWQVTNVHVIAIEHGPSAADAGARLELRSDTGGADVSSWKLSFPAGIPVRQNAVPDLLSHALRLRGKPLSKRFDLRQETSRERYGFNQPLLVIDYSGAEGNLLARVLIGSEVPGMGGYYATVISGGAENDETEGLAHMLFHLPASQVERLNIEADDLRKQSLAQLVLLGNQQQHLDVLELRSHSHVLRVEYKGEELSDKNSTLNELQNFIMTKPYPEVRGVDLYQLERQLKTLPNPVAIHQYIEDNPQNLAVYGLEPERRQEVHAQDNAGNELRLWLGKEADAENVYAMEAGYESVFTVGKQVLAVLKIEPFKIVDKFVALINIDKVAQISLQVRGAPNYQLQLLHTVPATKSPAQGVQAGKIELTGSKLSQTPSSRGRSLDEASSKDLYQEFLGIFLSGEVANSFFAGDEPAVSIIYSLRDGRQRRADFYDYPVTGYYALSIDGGEVSFVVEKRQLDQLQQTIVQVMQTGQLNVVK